MHDISHGGDVRRDALAFEYDANTMMHFEFSKKSEKYVVTDR